MKNRVSYYLIIWAILLGIFNILSFLPKGILNNSDFSASFWVSYIFVTISLVIQLICTISVFNANKNSELFYNFPLLKTGVTILIVSVIVGGVIMATSFIPYWISIIICYILLGIYLIQIIRIKFAINEVKTVDNKIQKDTFFIKALTVDSKSLISISNDEFIKEQTNRIYDAIRFSDPMTNPNLQQIETQIKFKFDNFANAVYSNDKNLVYTCGEELLILIQNRNEKCKLFK